MTEFNPNQEQRFRKWDLVALSVTLGLSCLYLHAGVYAVLGKYIIGFLTVFAFLNPFSAVAYLAATQTLPDPVGLRGFTPAQLSVLGYGIYVIYGRRFRESLGGIRGVIRWLAPYLIWGGLLCRTFIWGVPPVKEYELFAYSAAAIAATYVTDTRGRLHLWLFALSLGGVVGIAGWVFHTLGMPAMVKLDAIGGRGTRIYIGRTANAGSIGLNAGIFGMLSVLVFIALYRDVVSKYTRKWLWVIGTPAIISGPLAMLASLSRGGVATLMLSSVSWLFCLYKAVGREGIVWIRRVLAVGILVFPLLFLLSSVLPPMRPSFGPSQQLKGMYEYTQEQSEYADENVLVAGRQRIWYDSLRYVLTFPIFGRLPGDTFEWAASTQTAHNAFLDVAKGGGVPGLLLYLVYFAGPTIVLVRRFGWRYAWPFVAVLSTFAFSFSHLSFHNYKMFHAYNGMLIGFLAAHTVPKEIHRRSQDLPETRRWPRSSSSITTPPA